MAQATPQVSELLEKALALPTEDRELLTDRLVASLGDEAAEDGAEAAWNEEIKRRVDDIRAGRVKTIPGEQVLSESARWFEKLDEFGLEPFALKNRRQPILKSPSAPRRSRRG